MTVTFRSLEGWSGLTRADRALIVLLLGGALVSLAWIHGVSHGAAAACVEIAGEVRGEYPLSRPRVIRVRGPLGESVVRISEGGVRVASAPCAHQLCRQQGRITRRGQVIVCVPNQLVVTVIGAAPAADVDAVVR